jgi:hypothetical protein
VAYQQVIVQIQAAGLKVVFPPESILTQGNPDLAQFQDIFPCYETFMQWLGFQPCHLLRACGLQGPGEVKDQPQTMQEAVDLARKIMGA